MAIKIDDARIKICQTTFLQIKAAVTQMSSQGVSWEKATFSLIDGQTGVVGSECNKLLETAECGRSQAFKTYQYGVTILNRLSQAEEKSPELVTELSKLNRVLKKIQGKLSDYQSEYARYAHAVKTGNPLFYEYLTPWVHPDVLTAQAVVHS